MQLEAALSTGFRRLFNYIQGNNKNSEFHVTAITFTQGKLSLCCWGCASFILWRCGKSVTKPTRHNGSILMLHNKFTENWGSKASMDGKVRESALSFLLSTLKQFLLSYFCLAQQFAAIFMRIYIVCVAGWFQFTSWWLIVRFNICKSYTSWLYFSPFIIIMMFGMCGYSFFFFLFFFLFNKRTSFLAGSIEAKVEMTAPVTCHVKPGAGPACESQFTVSFYIPEEHQATPPEPNEPEVFIEHRKELTVYVR